LVQECKVCGICAQSCPQHLWSLSEAENFVFGRERRNDEEFGIYRKLVMSQAKDGEALKVCQDGGLVTTLLLFALKNGLIDGAVVAGVSEETPLLPVPKLVSDPSEILHCAGTKYCYSPNILALREVVKQKKTSIAFVGLPCQIRALRKMQMCGLKKYVNPIKFLIGLACSECFSHDGLMKKHIQGTLNIDMNTIKKMNIKGKMLLTTESEVKTVPLAEAKKYARENCRSCNDFSSELADISAGGLGLDAWTLTIIRTEIGEKLFTAAQDAGTLKTEKVAPESNTLGLLRKLSKKKRENSLAMIR
jgi:coenzyme F420 hydrogenase subunit beta